MIKNLKPCVSYEQFECEAVVYNEFVSKNIYELCSPYCPLECKSIYYSYATSSSHYPTPSYYKYLMTSDSFKSKFYNKNPSYDQTKNSLVLINFYYNDFVYTLIEDIQTRSLFDVVSGVGGTFGLFLGLSFLSFIEILEIFIDIFFVLKEKTTVNDFTIKNDLKTKDFY